MFLAKYVSYSKLLCTSLNGPSSICPKNCPIWLHDISTFAVNDSCIITLCLHRVFGPLDSLSEVTPFTFKVQVNTDQDASWYRVCLTLLHLDVHTCTHASMHAHTHTHTPHMHMCAHTVVSLFYVSKIIHVYLFHGILFSFFSICMKIFKHRLFFSMVNEVVYSEVYHSLATITFQGYDLCYYLVGQYRQNT